MDQTRFKTVATGDEVIEQLYSIGMAHGSEPNKFELQLYDVTIPYSDTVENGTITLIVDRIAERAVYVHPNGDHVLETTARIEAEGEPFRISITPPIGVSHIEGAAVVVSRKMERIILDYIERHDKSA